MHTSDGLKLILFAQGRDLTNKFFIILKMKKKNNGSITAAFWKELLKLKGLHRDKEIYS